MPFEQLTSVILPVDSPSLPQLPRDYDNDDHIRIVAVVDPCQLFVTAIRPSAAALAP